VSRMPRVDAFAMPSTKTQCLMISKCYSLENDKIISYGKVTKLEGPAHNQEQAAG